MPDGISLIGLALALVGAFGWSHRILKDKMDKLEQKVLAKPSEEHIRILISDKLAPYDVGYSNIKQDIAELRQQYVQLDTKLDKVLYMLSNLGN